MTTPTCRAALAEERAKFEVWIKERCGVSKKSNPWPVWMDEKDGTYVYSQDEWEAWAAARAALALEAVPTRMLTRTECDQVFEMPSTDSYRDYENVQRKFCEVNGLTLASAPQPQAKTE